MNRTDTYLSMQMEEPEQFSKKFTKAMRNAGTGHTSDEHKKLLKIFLRFQATIETFRQPSALHGPEWPVVEETLRFLNRYAAKSLKKEEDALRESGYPFFHSHKASHDCFRAMIDRYDRAYQARDSVAIIGLKYDLFSWFFHHINGADVKCRAYISPSIGASLDQPQSEAQLVPRLQDNYVR